jgi:hypothetical protein
MASKPAWQRFMERHGPGCDVCGAEVGGEPRHWYDEVHPERPRRWLTICRACRMRPYAERLNHLHRLAWETTHETQRPQSAARGSTRV